MGENKKDGERNSGRRREMTGEISEKRTTSRHSGFTFLHSYTPNQHPLCPTANATATTGTVTPALSLKRNSDPSVAAPGHALIDSRRKGKQYMQKLSLWIPMSTDYHILNRHRHTPRHLTVKQHFLRLRLSSRLTAAATAAAAAAAAIIIVGHYFC